MFTTTVRRPAARRSSVDTQHLDWCGGGHHCGLGEHRSAPITAKLPGAGTVVITRVQTARGRQYADVHLSVALPDADTAARYQLSALLHHLTRLMSAINRHHARAGR
ncbi:hypothetical protein [Couchioplanes azureus]|uniref:hypothetical protein n=1 Tax=Couchioplanes caeruleus TaxID=56438 RepID=UPI0016703CF7|nr:hypothetical protein [Couchioplanes caeruleus]GGQ78508.1 hypothetical protein GCM10010166_55870 [Couchioplanes caeruleus subsp. azureus]